MEVPATPVLAIVVGVPPGDECLAGARERGDGQRVFWHPPQDEEYSDAGIRAEALREIDRAVSILRDRAVLPETLPDGRCGFDDDFAGWTPLVVRTAIFLRPGGVDESRFRRNRV